jgi:3-oxo-4,17-pregnadiene-20-carboxyl-CoA hydratase alpha subunit
MDKRRASVDAAQSAGRGHVVSWISSLHPNRPDDEPRIVALVQLEEGTRLVANLVDPPDAGPYEDRPVEVDFLDVDGTTMPCFRIWG